MGLRFSSFLRKIQTLRRLITLNQRVTGSTDKGTLREIKEWQAIMDYLRALPVKSPGELPTIPVDERAAEVRAIKAG
jgi:hypothetical protein